MPEHMYGADSGTVADAVDPSRQVEYVVEVFRDGEWQLYAGLLPMGAPDALRVLGNLRARHPQGWVFRPVVRVVYPFVPVKESVLQAAAEQEEADCGR
jgi:hypothetical protein